MAEKAGTENYLPTEKYPKHSCINEEIERCARIFTLFKIYSKVQYSEKLHIIKQ